MIGQKRSLFSFPQPHEWLRFSIASFIALALLAFAVSDASAATGFISFNFADNVVHEFQRAAQSWLDTLYTFARQIFVPLAIISVTWKMIQAWAIGTDIKGLFHELFFPLLFVAIFYTLLSYGVAIGGLIVNSAMEIALKTTGIPNLFSPSSVVDLAFDILSKMLDTAGKLFDKGGALDPLPIVIGVAYALIGAFAWFLIASIAVDMLVTIVCCWIMLYAGVLALGFGGGFGIGFSDKAKNYFQAMLSEGFRLIGIGLLIGIATKVLISQMGYIDTMIKAGQTPTISDGMTIVLSALLFKVLISKVPDLLVQMMSGQMHAASQGGQAAVIAGATLGAAGGAALGSMGASTISGGANAIAQHLSKSATAKANLAQNALNALTGQGESSNATSAARGSIGAASNLAGGGSNSSTPSSMQTRDTPRGQETPYSRATSTTGTGNQNAQPMSDHEAVMQEARARQENGESADSMSVADNAGIANTTQDSGSSTPYGDSPESVYEAAQQSKTKKFDATSDKSNSDSVDSNPYSHLSREELEKVADRLSRSATRRAVVAEKIGHISKQNSVMTLKALSSVVRSIRALGNIQ